MKPRQVVWIALQFVLTAGPVSLAGAQGQSSPTPHLTADVRSRLTQASRNPTLAPWQRNLMLEVARGKPADVAPQRSRINTGALADDGAWIGLPPPFERYQQTAVYDPVRDRMLVFGGSRNSDTYFNDVWALSLAGSPAWTMLDPAGSPPTARDRHTAIYDPVRDRMLVFGGYNRSGDTYYNDVWALSLAGTPAWSEITPAGDPPAARLGHSAIYDPVRDRMVVFGGFNNGGHRNDVWALSLAGTSAWSELTPAGSPPAPLWNYAAIYDPVRDRMVVLGGTSNDVWALSMAGTTAWSWIAGSPPVGGGYKAIYDPASDRMVVFAGDTEQNVDWVCALSLAGTPAWSEIVPAGTTPPARYGHSVIYDPVRGRMVVFGGFEGINYPYGNHSRYGNDAWALSLVGSPTWSALSTAAPSERVDHTAIYDPLRHSMVVFGGWDGTVFNDVWSLLLAGSQGDWSATSVSGSPPAARSGHTAIYDPVRDRMIVFGGVDSNNSFFNDVWALSLAGTPDWSRLTPEGSPPAPRWGHTAIYDPVRDRMIVYGGGTFVSSFNDVWALWLAGSPAWTALDPMGSPPVARSYHTAIYDPVRDRMIVFGGYGGGSQLNDVWALSLAGTPEPNEPDDADVWSELAPAGSPPTARSEHTAIYDPARDRMVVFGGSDNVGLRNDAWALSLAGTPAWSALAPAGIQPLGCYGHEAIYDAARDRMVVFGGINNYYSNDVYALEWNGPLVSVPEDADGHRRPYEIAPPRPNPSRGATTVAFVLGEPGRVVLDVLDIHGRRVRRLADEWFPAGSHASTWRGDDDRGHALGSGVYFIHMQGIGFQATRRIVRIQ